MTDLDNALDQLSEIHRHLAKTEVFRGFRALPTGMAGAVGLLGAFLQPYLLGPEAGDSFVGYWTCVAGIAFVVALSGTVVYYFKATDPFARKRSLFVVGQFLPCLVAGVLITAPLRAYGPTALALLPGIWAVLFSLGLFAASPYLPPSLKGVAAGYLVAGAILLTLAPSGTSLSPWGMGLTFGGGQIACAAAFYWSLERKTDGT